MPDPEVTRQPAAAPVAVGGVPPLASMQNPDGGWGYTGGVSWTEPTALALLALRAVAGPEAASTRKGLDWLGSMRRSDGGWSPHPAVGESTWVSSLVALVLHRYGYLSRTDPVLPWLLAIAGAESSWLNRARRLLLSGDAGEVRYEGWPWFPGSAAWVMPTALTILALREITPIASQLGLAGRVEAGRQFLLDRRCSDGGWNHGSSRALGYHGDSYPETTGVALLALRGGASQNLRESHKKAIEHLSSCRSVEGWSWLQMGLRAQGIIPPSVPAPVNHRLDARESAIYHLALSMMQGGDPWGSSA